VSRAGALMRPRSCPDILGASLRGAAAAAGERGFEVAEGVAARGAALLRAGEPTPDARFRGYNALTHPRPHDPEGCALEPL
jgi:hypothetical protein